MAAEWVFTCQDYELWVPASVPAEQARRVAEGFCRRLDLPAPTPAQGGSGDEGPRDQV